MFVRNRPFCFLQLATHNFVCSVLLDMEDIGEKAQFKTMFWFIFLDLQCIDCPSVMQLNFVIGPILDRMLSLKPQELKSQQDNAGCTPN